MGLAQYFRVFSEEGFESWETLLEITESDLDALGVKLGHRRILQREIALTKGVSVDQLTSRVIQDDRSVQPEDARLGSKAHASVGKRKYRRHPKPDENAPEKPPSAYVIFSNKIRSELKPENLSFTAIAKRVGERWQDLPIEDKEPFETEASTAKAKYHADMAEYKATKFYRDYQEYLNDFKAKNSSSGGGLPPFYPLFPYQKLRAISDAKRPRFDQEESTASNGSQGFDGAESLQSSIESRDRRYDPGGHGGTTELPSPASVMSNLPTCHSSIPSMSALGNASPLSASSPSTSSVLGETLTGPLIQRPNLGWHPREILPERGTSAHHLNRIQKLDKGTHQQDAIDSAWSSPLMTSRLARARVDPQEIASNSSKFLQQNSDSSSKSSEISSKSTVSTNPSSVYPFLALESQEKVAISLPPLSAVTLASPEKRSSAYADPRNPEVPAIKANNAFNAQRTSSSPFSLASSSGRKLESLQLPLPHNISFGQRPLPRPEHEEKLANIFDLQDIPRNVTTPKTPGFNHENSTPVPATLPHSLSPPKPHIPLHNSDLPALTHRIPDDTQEIALQPNADPLSVLAYAGRLVGRENSRQNSRQHGDQGSSP